jgi:DNA-binding NarL/FixJ family response regulator
MPLLNGLDAGRQLRAILPNVRLIYVTCNEDPGLAAKAFKLGASGFLLKSCAASELFQAIKEALANRSYVTPRSTAGMVNSLIKSEGPNSAPLTSRQREVLQLLAEGRSMKEAAVILDVTPRTVAFHKYRMMEELGLKSTAELVQYAIRHHIISM